jgi:dTDP-4-dehydrorhamnose reductase
VRVLITGGNGQLGVDLAQICDGAGDDVAAPGHAELDVTDRDAVLGAITSWRPDVVVNAAAWTAVDACEGDPDHAVAANGMAVRWLAEGCARAGAHLVQMSTDYVFDGELDRPYHEWDAPDPASVYGVTKLIGEREAQALGPSAAVVRTSWLCGMHGSNMLKTILRLADQHSELGFVDDQTGHPTFTSDLAVAVRSLAVDRCSGVWHVTNQTAVTWCTFAKEVLSAAGRDPGMVMPITTADLRPPRPAPRPANSVLDNAMLRMSGRRMLRDFREPLAETVAALLSS